MSTVKCDRCDNDATVHEVKISGGKSIERHLCERCASAAGVQIQPQQPAVTQILSQLLKGAAAGNPQQPKAPAQASASACPECGLSFAQFRQAGMLGCAQCYVSFEGQLGPLLSRAHEGGTHHVGKVPRSLEIIRTAPQPAGTAPGAGASAGSGGAVDLQSEELARATKVRKALSEAVSAENYERAALLRDELHKIEAVLRSVNPPAGAPSLARPPRATRKPKPEEGQPGAEGTQP